MGALPYYVLAMQNTLYQSLLSRLKNKHDKLSSRFQKSVQEGEFQKLRYRRRKETIERLKNLEKRIHGLTGPSDTIGRLRYKHWAVALALGAVVATANPTQAQTVDLSQPTIVGNAYGSNVLRGDLDNDGDLDLIFVSYLDDPIVLINEGGFSFTQSTIPVGNITTESLLADLDGDGSLDVFMQNGSDQIGYTFQAWLNDGAGNFTAQPVTFPTVNLNNDLRWAGDLDGDGDADIVGETQQSVSPYRRYVTVFPNNALDFSDSTAFPGPEVSQPNSTLRGLMDVDGDNDLDILYTAYRISVGNPLHTFSNNGSGAFNDAGVYTILPGFYNNESDTLDIDNDGDTDLIMAGSSYPTAVARVFTNDGNDVFTFTQSNLITLNDNGSVDDIFSTDINNDGLDEFVINTERDSTFIFQTTVGVGPIQIAKFQGSSIPASLDADGDADLLFGGAEISAFENQGGGSFIQTADLISISAVYDLDSADVDGDGDLDFVTAGPLQSRL